MKYEIIPCICFGLPCVAMVIFMVGSFLSFSSNEKLQKIGECLLRLLEN